MWSLVGDRSRAIGDPSCADDTSSNGGGGDPSVAVDTAEGDEEKIDGVGGAASGAPSAKKPAAMEVSPLVLASSVQCYMKEKIVQRSAVSEEGGGWGRHSWATSASQHLRTIGRPLLGFKVRDAPFIKWGITAFALKNYYSASLINVSVYHRIITI